jgi:nucleosome binding factor SPN SPT16 subunit
MMVEPSKELEEVYELLLSVEQILLENLKPDTRICDSYKLAIDHVKENKPEMLQYFVKANLG